MYNQALDTDPIVQCQKLVANCRASGQHHEDLQATITDANKAGLFGRDDKGVYIELPSLQLLHDVDTQWLSIFLMVEWVLDLYPVSSLRSLTLIIISNCLTGYLTISEQERTQWNFQKCPWSQGMWGYQWYIWVFGNATCCAGASIWWVHSSPVPGYSCIQGTSSVTMRAASGENWARQTSNWACYCCIYQKDWRLCLKGSEKSHICDCDG